MRQHTTRKGDTCTFTRTAGSGRSARGGSKRAESAAQPGRPTAAPLDRKTRVSTKCPACRQSNQARADGSFRAHRTSAGSWCSAGDLPTEAQVRRAAERAERKASTGSKRKSKKPAKKKRSVWTVGRGGLPGLGKRR